jgi:predicted phage tail protein
MANVILHGELAEKFNNQYQLDVQSPKEAVRALCIMVPKFKETFAEGSYYVFVENREQINIDEDNFDLAINGDIHIMPEIVGAKKAGLGKVLAGIALIGLSVVTGGAAAAAWAVGASTASINALAIVGAISTISMNIGISLMLGGAASLLSPKQNNNASDVDKQQSYLFDGSDINIQNGSCVPLIYGEVLAAGFPISVDISDAETNLVTGDTTYDTSIGGFNYTDYQVYMP